MRWFRLKLLLFYLDLEKRRYFLYLLVIFCFIVFDRKKVETGNTFQLRVKSKGDCDNRNNLYFQIHKIFNFLYYNRKNFFYFGDLKKQYIWA